ncbi:putative Histone-lysine N-methyltransferase NSD2, partial [Daphnia magna]
EFELLPGDLVLVRRRPRKKGLTKKFLLKFTGPFQVVKKVPATTFLVEDLPAVRKKNSFRRFHAHVCQFRRFNGRVDDEGDEDEQGIEDRMDEPDEDEEQLREIANVHERESEEGERREHEREKEERTTTTRDGRKSRRPVWMKDFTDQY